MTTTVTDDRAQSRYEIRVDGELAGFAQYYLHRDVAAFVHTEIGAEFGGRGLATTLIRAALDAAREHGQLVEPFCPFVRGFIAKFPEYRDLVPADQWERFGLAQSK
jgi:predicted GNAT family acetyltransferase